MFLVYSLKVTGASAVFAAGELATHGDRAAAVAAIPMLFSMWYATRLHARRRAPPGVRQ